MTQKDTKRAVVTKELILQAYEYKQRFGDKMTNVEMCKLLNISETTIYRIFSGKYDYLLKEEKEDKNETSKEESNPAINKTLGMISEQVAKLNNNIQTDNSEILQSFDYLNKSIEEIGDLIHIIAIYLMRNEKQADKKTKMATQIQRVHSSKRLSDALKK